MTEDMTEEMTELRAENMSAAVSGEELIKDVSFTIKGGELIALLGPNGAGKTTALRAALGLVTLRSGTSYLGGENVKTLSPISRARRAAYLPQTRPLAWPNRVKDIVALGRFSHGAAMGKLKGADRRAVEEAIKACSLEHLVERSADTLSGGELARVHCARAMAAQAPLLIADEPVAALDPRHQFRIMDLIAHYVNNGGGALVVLHELTLAVQYADKLIFMKNGEVVSSGAPDDILSSDLLADIYGIKADVNGRSVTIHGAL